MRYTGLFYFLMLFLLSCTGSYATKTSFEFRQLNNSTGLSNSSVNTIFQDSGHLLWIGTWDGLNRYDGYGITIFRPELNNPNSLSNQVILKIVEGKAGDIWVLTMHGINRYNKKTNLFTRYLFSNTDNIPLTATEYHIASDNRKTVFCAAKGWGLGYYGQDSLRLLKTKNLPQVPLKKMEFSPSGNLLLLYETGQLFKVKISYRQNGLISAEDETILADNAIDFVNFTENEILIIQGNKQLWRYSVSDKEKYYSGLEGIRKYVGMVNEGFVFLGNTGYFILNHQLKITHSPWLKLIAGREVLTVTEGGENIIWVGTDGDGVIKAYPRQKPFQLFNTEQIPEMGGGIVRAFCKIPGHSFWVGTKGRGVFQLDTDFSHHPKEDIVFRHLHDKNSSLNNSVYSLLKGADSLLFIGSDGDGLSVYDLKNSKLIDWQDIKGSGSCAGFKSVYSIYQDRSGMLWLGTSGYGMVRCRVKRAGEHLKVSNFKQYLANEDSIEGLSSNIIFSIIPGGNDKLWVGTRLGGLNLFNKNTQRFRVFRKNGTDSLSLSNNDILCLLKDTKDQLWVGTSLGLNRLVSLNNNGEAEFESFSVNEGLPNNTIHGLVCDEKNNLWISTNSGLSNFLVNENRFRNFTQTDGLQDNEFADGAFFKDPQNNILFFGGVNGFNYFNPSDIGENTLIPDLLVNEIKGQNQQSPLHHAFVVSPQSGTPPKITLKYGQNFFDINLGALSYINNEKCQYAYRLENFDQSWNFIQSRRNFSFTNVPPGEYVLWLRWSNSDGVWSKPVRAIVFQIKPVYWKSGWAVALYVLLGILFLLFIFNYYKKQQLLQQNILLRQKDKEMHQNQLQFFTNIAHEFQTPLTLIAGPSQKLFEATGLSSAHSNFARLIQRNAHRLLFLTQQLLDFRKAEANHLEIQQAQFDLVQLAGQIAGLFDELAFQKKIDYRVETPPQLTGWFDQDKLEKILFNLLSNAFKYTPGSGMVRLLLSAKTKVEILASNSGRGIPKEELPNLFERFSVANSKGEADPGKFRAGIGLAYTKSMVTAMGGTITVESEPNGMTHFLVSLPYNKNGITEESLAEKHHSVTLSNLLQNIPVEAENYKQETPEKIMQVEAFEKKKKTILIVEDEGDIRRLLKELLKNDYRLLEASNGVEALGIMGKETPDIIVSDVIMPEMDGIAFCKKVKEQESTCHIPVIMLTAKTALEHRVEGIMSGADSYIPKPFHPQHLEARIQNLLEQRQRLSDYFNQLPDDPGFEPFDIDKGDKDFIRRIIGIIKQNINNPEFHTETIEKEMGVSRAKLFRRIKQITGYTPGELIRIVRLNHASKLLSHTRQTVTEVFYSSGFNNRSYFYREFKKLYNMSPKEYQKSRTKSN
ncbi:DNA-binding response regulator, AraC family [hydrothermal vent metagenome]|uniref:DNA-binding response regulator, AraC family n=1 Tax=hydrothermal vent metagenome TaxID=652676 RepID=A0A3B0TQF8_9ZZZZ